MVKIAIYSLHCSATLGTWANVFEKAFEWGQLFNYLATTGRIM